MNPSKCPADNRTIARLGRSADADVMDPRLTNAQRDLDALLPEFMTIASPDKLKGTCWITVTDLALTRTTRSEDKADKSVLFIEGAWPSPDRRANVLLPAASRLRFDGCFWELWARAAPRPRSGPHRRGIAAWRSSSARPSLSPRCGSSRSP